MAAAADKSHIEQLWAARIAEESDQNATRLSNWHNRMSRDSVAVPEKAHVVFIASETVETIKIRSVG